MYVSNKTNSNFKKTFSLTRFKNENFRRGSITSPEGGVLYEVLDLLLQHVPEDFLHPRELFEADNQNPQQLLSPPG